MQGLVSAYFQLVKSTQRVEITKHKELPELLLRPEPSVNIVLTLITTLPLQERSGILRGSYKARDMIKALMDANF